MEYVRGQQYRNVFYVAVFRGGIVRSLVSGPYVTPQAAQQFCTELDHKVVTQKIQIEWTYANEPGKDSYYVGA